MTPSRIEFEPERQPRIVVPKIACQKVMSGGTDLRQRFSKSRNGCVTCKARRIKCDETKPTCQQCARRRITCDGYKIDVRWKQASEPKKQTSPKRSRVSSSVPAQRSSTTDRLTAPTHQDLQSNGTTGPVIGGQQQELPTHSTSDHMMDLDFPGPDVNQPSMNLPTPQSLGLLFTDFSQDRPQAFASPERASHTSNTSPPNNAQVNAIDYASELWNMEMFWEDDLRPLPTVPLNLGLSVSSSQAERIAASFHQQICHRLSIEEETDRNPWLTLVWPLARSHPVVYNAMAALTCFGMSKQQPQLRVDGAQHIHQSTKILTEDMNKGEIPLDAALAATLALGFAETWDYENSSSGLMHIRGGGLLLQQIVYNQGGMPFSNEKKTRLDFLARTWTYMDVLARFTCSDLSQPYPGDMPSPDLSLFGTDASNLDPLMGYASTLFQVMRNVADLINKVRTREASRNSPVIISQALTLRRAIEQWTLPIDLEAIEDPSQLMTDAIQTAEAYRWSTLLMLYQTVPELPNLTSYGELAQKILVYLATIPLSSTTIIVHIFPLMVAGCDAVEEEDRQFVRDRWNAISHRMVTGIVDRCLKITEETWKRREEYLWTRGLSFTSNGRQINATLNESTALSKDIASFINFGTSPSSNIASSGGSLAQSSKRPSRKGNDFPISAAFKKGVDMLTRSGCTEYTVRGRLHWLGVMEECSWKVMLG